MAHDAHELCVFFADATLEEKTSALLEICSRQPDFLLDVIREMNGGHWKKRIREILAHPSSQTMGSGYNPGPSKKISAIKECRSITGWGLKEAKDAVEKLMQDEHIIA